MARRIKRANLRVWLIRGGIGIAAGLLAGFAAGAVTVVLFQPPGVAEADSSAVASAPKAPIAAPVQPAVADEPEPPPRENGIVVPNLIGLEEGDARNAITSAGFSVGSVTFKGGSEPMGTVVASFPVPGEAVVLPATINLILSDGKGPPEPAALPRSDNASSTVRQPS